MCNSDGHIEAENSEAQAKTQLTAKTRIFLLGSKKLHDNELWKHTSTVGYNPGKKNAIWRLRLSRPVAVHFFNGADLNEPVDSGVKNEFYTLW